MRIISTDFIDKGLIPKKFTCMGEDISPALMFQNVPEEAVSLCLILDDPDAPGGTFTHWIVYNIPPTMERMARAALFKAEGSGAIKEGVNDFGKTGYSGPCPPRGAGEHRYFFHLYALTSVPGLPESATREMLIADIENNVLEEAILMPPFSRN